MVQIVAKTLARVESAKVRVTPTKTGRLLTPDEFKASESANMEAEAQKEDVRIANENKRIAAEKVEEKAKKSLIDSTDDELDTIDAEATKLKAQQKILTERGRKLRKERKAAEKEEKKLEEQLKREMLAKRRKMRRRRRRKPKPRKKRLLKRREDGKWTKVTTRKKSQESEAMDVEEGEASEHENGDDDASSVAESVEVTEETVEPSDDDVPTSVSDKSIWDNARDHFTDRKPMCFSECRKGHSSYALPDPTDKDGQSDDEEWLREERTNESPNKFYAVWIHKLKSMLPKYYGHDQKWKLLWAVDNYNVKRRNVCPFEICVMDKEKQKIYITKARFQRHIVEVHMHHHPIYRCAKAGKKSQGCKGLTTPRRSVMVRHYRNDHQKSARDSLDVVMKTHQKMMEPIDAKRLNKITGSTKYFGNTMLTPKHKLSAEFGLSHEPMRLSMCSETFLKVKLFRGDTDVEEVDGVVRMKGRSVSSRSRRCC